MPQTILAFLAMLIASLAAFNHQMAAIRIQEERVHIELEIMANAVGLENMETIAENLGYAGLPNIDGRETAATFQVEDKSEAFTLHWDVHDVDANGDSTSTATNFREVMVEVFHSKYPTRPLVRHTRIVGKD